MITMAQIRAARAFLDWDRKKLSEESGVTLTQIANLETGKTESPRQRTLGDIEKAFARHGVVFKDDGGIAPRRHEVRVLHGQQGFWDFYDDVYATVKEHGGNILISNADQRLFWHWLGDKRESHKARMNELHNFQQRIIVKEGTSEFLTNYATTEHREAPAKNFDDVPFYVYGPKLAIISFEDDGAEIMIIDHPKVARAYEKAFFALWDASKPVGAKHD